MQEDNLYMKLAHHRIAFYFVIPSAAAVLLGRARTRGVDSPADMLKVVSSPGRRKLRPAPHQVLVSLMSAATYRNGVLIGVHCQYWKPARNYRVSSPLGQGSSFQPVHPAPMPYTQRLTNDGIALRGRHTDTNPWLCAPPSEYARLLLRQRH
jgi:hypothetical protein